jgi:hypothetical protein
MGFLNLQGAPYFDTQDGVTKGFYEKKTVFARNPTAQK